MTPTRQKTKILTWVTAVFILLGGVFIGGYLVLKSGRGTASELSDILKGKTFEAGLCEPNLQDAKSDADQDGLFDWQEEQVYKTDPCQQDSDSDGYLDGEEVAAGYDPAKPAPGDELPDANPSKPRPLPSNLTLALKQKLSEQIIQNKLTAFNAAGEILSYDDLKDYPAIMETIGEINAASQQAFAPEKVSDEQIKLTADNSAAAIKVYAVALATSLKSQPGNQPYQTDSEMFAQALKTGNFDEVKLAETTYQDAYQKVRQLTVPRDFLSLHKEILDILSTMTKVYGAIQNFTSDPLKTNLALQVYQNINSQLYNWLGKVNVFIQQHPE